MQTFSMVRCSDRKVTVRTGRYIYEMEEERGRRKGEEYEPICRGLTGLDYDGALLSGVHRLPCSWKRNPVVYVQDDIVIDSRGEMMLPQEHRYPYDTELSLISALEWGALCITSDRRVLCRGELTLEEADPALGITTCEHGYLVQTQCGDVYFSTNGRGWQLIGDNASAISASGDLVAWADTEGTVYLYQYGKHNLNCVSVRRFPGRYVTELDVSSRLVALKFLDGRFDVIDWHTGKTALDDLLIAPDFAEE